MELIRQILYFTLILGLITTTLADRKIGSASKRVSQIHGNQIEDLDQKILDLNNNDEIDEEEEKINREIENRHRGKGKFSCITCVPPDCEHVRTCNNAIRCYTAHVRDVDGFEHKSKGCTRNHQQTMLHCATKSYDGENVHKRNNQSAQYAFQCCQGNMCNENTTFPTLPPVPMKEQPHEETSNDVLTTTTVLLIVIPVILIVFVSALVIYCMRQSHLKRMDKMNRHPDIFGADHELAGLRAVPVGDSTLREYQRDDSFDATSGSGSGHPKLIERRFSKDISLIARIGGGRYGEVWEGRHNMDKVAVKIFSTRDEESYKTEKEVYKLLRGGNVPLFKGDDTGITHGGCTTHWIVTEFFENGSLYDYLNRVDSLMSFEALRILESAARGLKALHEEIHSSDRKPSIAHRDIKSKNILVRDNGTCVLADFGLAVTQDRLPYMVFTEDSNTRVGTKRYMSPEVLDLSIIKKESRLIEDFKKSDMYSFALVMWEVLRKTRLDDSDPTSADEFALPYHLNVGPDPSFEDMRKVVCIGNERPSVPEKWIRHENSFTFKTWKIMKECWDKNPSSRHTSVYLHKHLAEILKNVLRDSKA